MMQMNLESVIQSEGIQKENSSYINAYIWNLDSGTDEPTCRAGLEMQTERMDFRTWNGLSDMGKERAERLREQLRHIRHYV